MKPEDIRKEIKEALHAMIQLSTEIIDQMKAGARDREAHEHMEAEMKKIEDRAVENILNIGAKHE